MPSMVNRRAPQKSGAAKAAEKLGGLLPGMRSQKRGGSRGRSKKGTAGLALLAGAAGLVMKNRQKLTSMIRDKDSDETVQPVQPRPVPGNSGPVGTPGAAYPPASPGQPAA